MSVDVAELRGLAGALARLADRCGLASAPVVGALHAEPGRCPAVAGELVQAARCREQVVADLQALAALVQLVAHVYAGLEQQVATSFGAAGTVGGAVGVASTQGVSGGFPAPDRALEAPLGAPTGALLDLLGRLEPDVLEGLLVASPELARTVVEAEPAAGTDAAALAGVLAACSYLSATQSAARVRTFLARYSPTRRRRLALLHPALMTAARSAPPPDRFAASRVLVAADLGLLLRRISWMPPGRRQRDLGVQIAQRREWLDGSVVLRHPDGSVSRRRHQLLSFSPRGDGTVVEVLGDLEHARHLAVFVPGTGSDLQRYPHSLERMVPFAAAAPGLAVVLWQGADHPDKPFDDGVLPLREHVLAAAYRDAADVAGPALAADVEGLRAAAPDAAHDLTVLGHSYGGSIVGSAEAHGMVADRVVHIASAGAYVDDVSQYAAEPGRTLRLSMTAYDDPIRLGQGHDLDDAEARLRVMGPHALDPVDGWWAPGTAAGLHLLSGEPRQVGHGLDPDLLPGVVRLDLGVDAAGRPVGGHSGMFRSGSTAWDNLLASMTGDRVQVLESGRWSSHLEPMTGQLTGQLTGQVDMPHYVVDRTPWSGPGYHPPVLDLSTTSAASSTAPSASDR